MASRPLLVWNLPKVLEQRVEQLAGFEVLLFQFWLSFENRLDVGVHLAFVQAFDDCHAVAPLHGDGVLAGDVPQHLLHPTIGGENVPSRNHGHLIDGSLSIIASVSGGWRQRPPWASKRHMQM